MEWHWIVIGLIIIGIVAFQIVVFRRTLHRLSEYGNVFPKFFEDDWVVDNSDGYNQFVLKTQKKDRETIAGLQEEKRKKQDEREYVETQIQRRRESDLPYDEFLAQLALVEEKCKVLDSQIIILKENARYDLYFASNPTLKTIIDSINVYLKKNKENTIDYHLIKDIVDRNCDAIEEEIQAQLPMPLYAGLAGTMSGVIVGVGYLWGSGGLERLINGGETDSTGADGIEAVLGGIALAMIASLVGISFTTIGSWRSKTIIAQVEENKQRFLSWLQQELLPKLKTGVDAEIGRITDNIKKSNESFAENTTKLNSTLADINQAISGMTGMMRSIQGLNIVQIASANIQVYEKLKNCSDELGKFAQYITSLDGFIAKIDMLSTRMGNADDRVRAIEEMGQYFREERSNLEAMKGVISSSIGEADADLKNSVVAFKESTSKSYQELATHNEQQRQALERAIDEQQNTLQLKLKERIAQLDYLAEELKKLAPIKEAVANFEKATKEQNRKIDDLTASIRELAKAKAEGGNGGGGGKVYFPQWAKWTLIIGVGIIGITCLTYLVPKIATWVSDLLTMI